MPARLKSVLRGSIGDAGNQEVAGRIPTKNVVILGPVAAGKTSLVRGLIGKEFGSDPQEFSTIGFKEPHETAFGCFYDFSGEQAIGSKKSFRHEFRERIEEIDPTVALFVIDLQDAFAQSKLHTYCSLWSQCAAQEGIKKFLVITKCDTDQTPPDINYLTEKYPFDSVYRTSVAKGIGIQDLRSAIIRSFPADNDEKTISDAVLVVRAMADQLCELIAKNPKALSDIEWRDLERLLSQALAGLGFSVYLTPPAKDGGKDIVANCVVEHTTHKYYIEVKHWRSAGRPGDVHVADFIAVNASDNTDGGLFISSSGFTQSVYGRVSELTKQKVRLGQKEKIVSLCQNYIRKRNGVWYPDKPLPDLLFEDTLTVDS